MDIEMHNSFVTRFLGSINFHDSIIQNRKYKLILNIVPGFIMIISYLILTFSPGFSLLLALICLFSFIGIIIISLLTSKFYNGVLILYVAVIAGLFFKRLHWPLAGDIMIIGTFSLVILSCFNSAKAFYDYSNRTFLKWFICLAGMISVLFMSGLLNMNQHWSGLVRAILIYSGCFLFFLTVLGMVFMLPFSNYVAWSEIERDVFFRIVLIPMIFIFSFFILVFVFPDYYNSLMGRFINYAPWIYADSQIHLFNLEGIPLY